MTEEGTVTPEIRIQQLEEQLATETDRLQKLFAAYEAVEKELFDARTENEVLEKEIIEREIEKETQEALLNEREIRVRELELRAVKAGKQVEHLKPELEKMEEKYSREKDRLGKVFGIAEELDNDLRLAVSEMKARDDWYVDHMQIFEDLNKAIKQRYDMIERAVEAERKSQHMSRAFTERMDDMVEARAADMTIEEAEQITVETESASVEIVGENAVEDLLDDGKLNNSNTAPAEEATEEEPAVEAPAVEAPAEEPAEEVPSDWSNGEDPWAE
jgi:chromosome segregation ATPase